MLPSCKEVAEQVSQNIDEPLTGSKWLKLKFHLLICAYCRRYGDQMALSSKTVESLGQNNQPSDEQCQKAEKTFKDVHCEHKHSG